MFKLIWVLKKYKNFFISEIVEEVEMILKECREYEKWNVKFYVDLMIM